MDDTTNTPLTGITVRLDPWIAYPTPGPTPTPILVTTTDANGDFVLPSVANGQYLLLIGSDVVYTPPPAFTTPSPIATDTPIPGATHFQATVHDRIVLSGGGSSSAPVPLTAPTMPPEPLYTPPATETQGAYRLATIDPLTEAPCYLAYNQERLAHALAPVVLDEWSVENARAINYGGTQPNSGGQVVTFLTAGNGLSSGFANCYAALVGGWFSPSNPHATWTLSAGNRWYGGQYMPSTLSYSAVGAENFPNDPRIFADPNGALWP